MQVLSRRSWPDVSDLGYEVAFLTPTQSLQHYFPRADYRFVRFSDVDERLHFPSPHLHFDLLQAIQIPAWLVAAPDAPSMNRRVKPWRSRKLDFLPLDDPDFQTKEETNCHPYFAEIGGTQTPDVPLG